MVFLYMYGMLGYLDNVVVAIGNCRWNNESKEVQTFIKVVNTNSATVTLLIAISDALIQHELTGES